MKIKQTILIAVSSMSLAACGGDTDAKTGSSEPVQTSQTAAVTNTPWRLSPDDSRIAFVSIKAGDAAESHYFKSLSGTMMPDGMASITIPLDSVETNVDIRNERMRNVLFETAKHPEARISTQIDLNPLTSTQLGERVSTALELTVDLHGTSVTVPADVFITRLGNDRVSVETKDPVLVHAADFALAEGVDQLREIAGLPSISAAVPVTATLVFERRSGE